MFIIDTLFAQIVRMQCQRKLGANAKFIAMDLSLYVVQIFLLHGIAESDI